MRLYKIYSDLTTGVIRFDGSTVRPKALASCVAVMSTTHPTRIIIKSKFPKQNGDERIYFGRLNVLRIQNKDGVKLVETLGFTTPQVLAYLNTEFERTLQVIDAEYKGVWNALTNTPDVTADPNPVAGDWYFTSVAGNYNGLPYEINDQIRYSGSQWEQIKDQSAKVTEIENSARAQYDIYVDASYTGQSTGSILKPFGSINLAINNSSSGDKIFIKGTHLVSNKKTLPHSLFFYGVKGSEIKYVSYDSTNACIFEYDGDYTQSFGFEGIKFSNAGEYALKIYKGLSITIEDCEFKNNGWNGTGLSTTLAEAGGVLGYDSTDTALQSFYASSNASNGGAMRIEGFPMLRIIGNEVSGNLRGIRVSDCGINGAGFITRNVSSNNIESGIYLSVGSLGGCQNVTVTMNFSAYNANNGLLVIGGLNNKFSQNEVNGNWNAGFCAWGSGNTTLRDCGLYDNNRSSYNGIGNTGDAKASIQINEAYDLLGTNISVNPNFRFIAEVLDTQVHYTGLGSNTAKVGFLITESVGDLASNDKNIIKIDDVGFIGQDYAIDFSEVDLTNLRVSLGDNSFQSIGEKAVRSPLAGDFFELPFSNHTTNINHADISVDSTGNVIINEGVGGNRLNPYKVNDLEAVAFGTDIKVILKGSDKIQFIVPVAGTSIDGSFVNSVLNQAIMQINGVFTNTVGFVTGNNAVNGFTLSGDNLTLTLEDSTSFTVDVTTLGVDENKFVTGAALAGSDLTLTMSDATTITVDASGLAVDTDTIIVSGVVTGDDLILTDSDGGTITIDASTLGGSGSAGNPVVSGSVVGTNLVLVLDDASTVTIDASNMINGSTGLAVNADWFVSYGTDANTAVNHPQTNLAAGVAGNAPFYFGTSLTRGSEMKWNHTLVNKQSAFGIWAGTEAPAGTYNSRVHSYNWSTAFRWFGSGFGDFNANMDLITSNINAGAYAPVQGSEMKLRFGTDGHLSLINVVSGAEVLVMKTTIPLSVTEFKLQMGSDQNQNFPNAQVVDIESLWEIVHDFNNNEGGIDNGILDHTVIKSGVSIELGEKIMFMLDEVGQGDFFGTNYTNASTSISTAEEQLDNQFKYQTNEALVFTQGGANDWNMNTNANGYFFAANLDQYREGGGSGTVQGMFSLRFNTDGKLTIYDEDAGVKVATAKIDPQVGSSVHLFMGVRGNRAYYSIPTISKQSLNQGSQPETNFVPTVANQTVSVTDGEVLNFQVVSSDNIVNQYVEVDAPSWMSMNQNTGVLSGTASGGAATYVVNCKAGNAIGGTIPFTVTVTVEAIVSYNNTKSIQFNGSSSYLAGNATLMDSMDRATNGDGNAWSIGMWVKPNNNTATQTLFVYGAGDDVNGGTITIQKVNANNLLVRYGTTTENIILFGNAFTHGNWSHVLITFDGGTTGNTAADVNDYYSRFNVYVNGALTTTIDGSSGGGYTGVISGENTSDNIFRFGRASNVHNNYFEGLMNSMAIWNSDQSSNVSDIYNSGTLHDLNDLTEAPQHYYEIESSVTSVPDTTGSANLTGYNFAASDLVTDTP